MEVRMSDRGDIVSNIPLFAGLSAEQRDSLGRLFFRVERSGGETIVTEGDDSIANFYVIASGEAVVTLAGKEIRRLGPGDYFGEMAFAKRRPRSATVTAVGPIELLAVSGWNFAELLSTDSAIREAVEHAVAEHSALDDLRTGQRESQGAH
jgi:CRP-like cAMP-binding protein